MFLFVILIVGINSIKIDQEVHQAEVQKSSWGKIAITLAQLTNQNDGSMKELQDVIDGVVKNVDSNLHDVQFAYEQKKRAYHSQTEKLGFSIDEAITTIARNQQFLDEVVKDYYETVNKRLESLDENIAENKKQQDYLTEMRKKTNNQFLDKLNNYEHMISQVDMCVALLSGIFTNGELLQRDRIKAVTKKIVGKYGLEGQPLLQLVQQADYSNKEILKQLMKEFENLRNTLVDNKNSDIAYDQELQEQFESDIRQLQSELFNFKRDVAQNIYQLSLTQEKERETKEVLEQKKVDLEFFQKQINLVEEGSALEDGWNAKLNDEYANQLQTCQQAAYLIKSPEFQVKMDNLM